jgi:hypothetical protein
MKYLIKFLNKLKEVYTALPFQRHHRRGHQKSHEQSRNAKPK